MKHMMRFKRYTKQELTKLSILGSKREWRDRIRIAIVDDQGLSDNKIVGLRSRGFVIDPFSDVENIRTMSDYPIVISDVVGVATKLDSEKQGLALITELSKVYPFKGLAVYSGAMHKLPSLPEGVIVINKDDDLDLWSAKIDKLIDGVANPVSVWNNFAKRLIDIGVPTIEIAKLEDDFVDRVINHKSFEGFPKTNDKITVEAQNVITSLIANGIFLGMTKLLGL